MLDDQNVPHAAKEQAYLMMLTGFKPEGLPSKKWLKPRMNSRRGTACMRVMLPSMLLLFSTSSTAYLSGVNEMPSSANDTVVKNTPCSIQDRFGVVNVGSTCL